VTYVAGMTTILEGEHREEWVRCVDAWPCPFAAAPPADRQDWTPEEHALLKRALIDLMGSTSDALLDAMEAAVKAYDGR
jgi:hypothetical protein